jgi:hypothetical protein
MIDAYDLNDPDPEKRELASVQLVDELFGPGLLDRLAKQEGCEVWLREVRARQNDTHRTVAHGRGVGSSLADMDCERVDNLE